MMIRLTQRLLTLTLLSLASCQLLAMDVLKSQMVKMRDGVHLSTDIYMNGSTKTPKPTILIRTVYNKNQTFSWNPVWKKLVEQGYAIAIQDIRGRFESEGRYKVGYGRREDGIDTLDWIVAQPWSNGKVGLSGCSYLGEAQVVLETTKHPALVVGQPQSAASGYYRPGRAWQSFSGGAFELAQTAGWFAGNGSNVFYGPNLTGQARSHWFNSPQAKHFRMLPDYDFKKYLANLKSLPTIDLLAKSHAYPSDYQLWRNRSPDDVYFRNMDLVKQDDTVSVPNLFFDTWYDYGARETLMMAEQFRQSAQNKNTQHQYVIIGPGTHCNFPQKDDELTAGNRPLANTAQPYNQIQLDWYNYWLKGQENRATQRPFLTYYVLGANEWRTANEWPIKNTQYQKWFLSHTSEANSRLGGGRLETSPKSTVAHDQFIYTPENPVPSLGGHTCCTGTDTEAGGYDQSTIELRQDVLVYTSVPLKQGIEMTGLIKANIYVSSSTTDTDFTVKLVDVYPDGTAYNIQEGITRMRYRNSLREPSLITPNQIYEIQVDLNASSNYFAEGHRIRVEISSSNFPRFERNLNTGQPNHLGTTFVNAVNSVFHGGDKASYIELPIIP